jgi:hypothetical protein
MRARDLERDSRGDQANGDEHRCREEVPRAMPGMADASAIAIDAEYTITKPIASSSNALHDNEAS